MEGPAHRSANSRREGSRQPDGSASGRSGPPRAAAGHQYGSNGQCDPVADGRAGGGSQPPRMPPARAAPTPQSRSRW
eukprot:2162721-Pyramimonas_sp.AAC.1